MAGAKKSSGSKKASARGASGARKAKGGGAKAGAGKAKPEKKPSRGGKDAHTAAEAPAKAAIRKNASRPARAAAKAPAKRKIEAYEHPKKERLNNPPVGLVTAETDPDGGKKTYQYDPHLDPQLQWAGKAERTSFEIPTVSLHVHERIDPRTIIEAVRRRNGDGHGMEQGDMFGVHGGERPLREAVEFYKHKGGWMNRLVAGDSLLVMNSLLEKEGMAGKVQMVYFDPPYGITYGSNFQPFVNKREMKSGKDRDENLNQEPEVIKAFRDTWELGIHSYLAYLRDRLLLAREMLADSGSIFVQISDENVHHVREIMEEVFQTKNFVAQIAFQKTGGQNPTHIARIFDTIIWYAKDKAQLKFKPLFNLCPTPDANEPNYVHLEMPDGTLRAMTPEERERKAELPQKARIFRYGPITSAGGSSGDDAFTFDGETFTPPANAHWKTTIEGLTRLVSKQRILRSGRGIAYKLYWDDFPAERIANIWTDTQSGGFNDPQIYVVQTTHKVIQRCLLMSTDPGDVVLDPTCGSGTTARIAEQWGRRWITCDTSRVAVALAKQRLMTASFDYYQLAYPEEGVDSGFLYRSIPHVKLQTVANNEPPKPEILYDQPLMDRQCVRVTGPFTVEAVPAPAVKTLDESDGGDAPAADPSIARSGETLRQTEWRDELLRSGIRGKGGQRLMFSRVEPLAGTRWLQADAETREDAPQRAVISFGPEHAPLEQRQVGLALEEAQKLVPKPKIVVFAAFQFDPEAAKDIDETQWPGVAMLKAQMNADMLTDDLKKKRASNESYWLIGQPDVELKQLAKGPNKGQWQVTVRGFDYYDTRTGALESGDANRIAMWMLDPDYDGRSLFPRQVFFPMAGDKEGWAKLAKNLKAEIDEARIESYRGIVSLPFETGKHKRVAIKIIDDRGIESLKVIRADE